MEGVNQATAVVLAELFKAFSDPSRIKIVSVLVTAEWCVHDIARIVGLSESATSHQLRILRQMHLVRSRKEGKHVYYALDDEHIKQLYQLGLDHIQHRIV
jgi:ArsR family transcriptional regulator, lead/cadmium/zinc/bismuth-responsive transcriptional repressor